MYLTNMMSYHCLFYVDINAVPQIHLGLTTDPIATSDSLSFSWNSIQCQSRGASGLRYAYSLKMGDTVVDEDIVTDDTTVTFPGLIPCTEYTFEVRAVNDIGDGPRLVRVISTLAIGKK